MIGNFDPVTAVHRGLCLQQFRCIRELSPELFVDQHERLASYSKRGRKNMESVMRTSGITSEEIGACMSAVDHDARFSFVRRLPVSAALGSAVGDTVETSLTGMSTPESSELATLVNLFITLLDGLIDETPDLFEPEKQRIASLLRPDSQIWERNIDNPIGLCNVHPLVDIVYKLLFDGARRLRESQHWSNGSELRSTFRLAVDDALRCEYASHMFQSIDERADVDTRLRAIERKSEAAVWVSALVPICVNGWPNTLDQAQFRDLTSAIGRFFGWIDDISDVFTDIGAKRWNSVLLALSNAVELPSKRPETWHFAVATAISFDRVADNLVELGVAHFVDILHRLDELDVDCTAVKKLVADAAYSWLAGAATTTTGIDSIVAA